MSISPHDTATTMDWFSWLSRTNLDPALIYEYGLAFARNELQKEDLAYFNHEFLKSMGISVAKHRLEILKLAKKEVRGGSTSFSKFLFAINKTKKGIVKYINKYVFHEEVETTKALPEPVPELKLKLKPEPIHYHEQWKVALTRNYNSEKELKVEKPILKTRRIAKSGPLDGRMMQEKLQMNTTNRSLKLSGPLDRNIQERLMFTYRSPVSSGPLDGRLYANRSPKLSGPLDRPPPSPKVYTDYGNEKLGGGGGYDDNTLWAALFQDLKPT